MSYKKSKQIHDALKKLGIEITPADNAPVWLEDEDRLGSFLVLAGDLKWEESLGEQVEYDPGTGAIAYGKILCPDYTNASNSLAVLVKLRPEKSDGPITIWMDALNSHAAIAEPNGDEGIAARIDVALFKLLLAALGLEEDK